MVDDPRIQSLRRSQDIVLARQLGRDVALQMEFSLVDQTRIATAISEIARNVLQHSGSTGEMLLQVIKAERRLGLEIQIHDQGCGIPDLDRAMEVGVSTNGGLGAGLPGSKRLMDIFEIETTPGAGTRVRMVKWKR